MAKNYTLNVIYFGIPAAHRLRAAGALEGSMSKVLIITASVFRTQLIYTHKSYNGVPGCVERYQVLEKKRK